MSPLEALVKAREQANEAIDRVMSELVVEPKEHAPNDLRAVRLLLVDLHDSFLKRGEKEKAADCLRAAQHITAELR